MVKAIDWHRVAWTSFPLKDDNNNNDDNDNNNNVHISISL